MEGLTPGDFAVVHQNGHLFGQKSNAAKMLEKLLKEVAIRGPKQAKVGFL